MENFEGLNLSPLLAASLAKMNYTSPTPIQAKAIPLALQGRDIMGSAQTGTGKTAAFSIPLIQTLLTNPRANALVLTPTRELVNKSWILCTNYWAKIRVLKLPLLLAVNQWANNIINYAHARV